MGLPHLLSGADPASNADDGRAAQGLLLTGIKGALDSVLSTLPVLLFNLQGRSCSQQHFANEATEAQRLNNWLKILCS